MEKHIADWTNPGEYPNPDNTSPQRWAFEFLRRNKEYQKDFSDYLDVCESIVPGFNPFTYSGNDRQEKNDALEDDERHFVFDPPRLDGESESAWINRVERGRRTPLPVWYAEKWGLDARIFDPFAPYHFFNVSFADHEGVHTAGPAWEGFRHIQATYHSEAFIIDYRKPLASQIEAIRECTKHHQSWLVRNGHIQPLKEHREKRGKVLRQYLRCLDAVDAGVTQTEIANALSKEDEKGFDISRIGKAIKTAEKLREEGYRYLLRTGK